MYTLFILRICTVHSLIFYPFVHCTHERRCNNCITTNFIHPRGNLPGSGWFSKTDPTLLR